jgi:hypothetical protein
MTYRPAWPVPLAAAALAFASFGAAAQIAPGLWEHRVQFKSQSGEMEKSMAEAQARMAELPPDQRKMVEQMMAKNGMAMGPQGTSVKSCISKEEAARREPPPMSRPECTQEVVSRTSNSMKVKWQCSGKDPSSGEGEVTYTSDKTYTGHAVMNSMRNGKPETTNMESSGKWLAADCGDVKPRTTTKP